MKKGGRSEKGKLTFPGQSGQPEHRSTGLESGRMLNGAEFSMGWERAGPVPEGSCGCHPRRSVIH